MTTKRTFFCNFCGDDLTKTGGAGVAWDDQHGTALRLMPIRNSENHICNKCATAIKALPHFAGDRP